MQIALSGPQRVNTTAFVKELNKKGERQEDGGRVTSLIKRSSILGVKMLPISIFEWVIASEEEWECQRMCYLALLASLVTSQAHVMKFWLKYDTMDSAHIIWEQKTLLRTLSSLWR